MLTQHAYGTKQSKHQKTNLRQVNISVCLFEARAVVGLQLHVLGTQKKQTLGHSGMRNDKVHRNKEKEYVVCMVK